MKESNEKIAEFLGFQKSEIGWFDSDERLPLFILRDSNTFDELHFHESWDWLMSAYKYCQALCHANMLNEWESAFEDVLANSLFSEINGLVVEFIDWFIANMDGHDVTDVSDYILK